MKEGMRSEKVMQVIEEKNKSLEHNEHLAESYKKIEHQWGAYDSWLRSFAVDFFTSLPGNHNLNKKDWDKRTSSIDMGEEFKRYIETTLSQRERHDLAAVEFGGPGSHLFSEFSENFFKRTIGICLKDVRDKKQKETDENNNHFVIQGDLLDIKSNEIFTEINKKLGTTKIDLIISRMEGPLNSIDKNQHILDHIIREWYGMLNENGLMFIKFELDSHYSHHTPTETRVLIETWANSLREKFPEIDIQISSVNGTIRLHKKVGAPEHLPPATQLFTQPKNE